MKLLEILLLVIPAVSYALWNGRNGIKHPATGQTLNVCLIMMWSATGIRVFEIFILKYPVAAGWKEYITIYSPMWAVSITGFGLLFTYSFNWYWFSKMYYGSFENRLYYTLTHLSKTALPDRIPLWIKFGWFGRLITYIILFSLAIYWFW